MEIWESSQFNSQSPWPVSRCSMNLSFVIAFVPPGPGGTQNYSSVSWRMQSVSLHLKLCSICFVEVSLLCWCTRVDSEAATLTWHEYLRSFWQYKENWSRSYLKKVPSYPESLWPFYSYSRVFINQNLHGHLSWLKHLKLKKKCKYERQISFYRIPVSQDFRIIDFWIGA